MALCRRRDERNGGGESTAERLSMATSPTEGMEEGQQSLAQIERAGEILHVPACHMVRSRAAAQCIQEKDN